MEETTGEITFCSKEYNSRKRTRYYNASAKFSVNGKEYDGHVDVTSHKYVGQPIKILYNPKNPNDFISKSSTYSGITMIIYGLIFLIPKLENHRKNKKALLNEHI